MERRKVSAHHFKNYINLNGFQKQGNRLLYTKTAADDCGYQTDLWVFDTISGTQRQLTKDIAFTRYKWDGEEVVISALIEEEDRKAEERGIPLTCIYRLADGAEPQRLLKINKNVSDFARIGNKRYILLCDDSLREDALLKRSENLADFVRRKEEEEDYFVAEEVPFWANGTGYCDGNRGRLFLWEDGKLTQLTADDFSAVEMSVFEDRYVVYYGMKSGGVQNTTGRLYCYDMKSKKTAALDESDEYVYTYVKAVSTEKIYVCRNDRTLHGEYQDEYIDLLDLKDGSYLRKNSLGDYHIYDSVICDVTYKSGYLNKLTRTDRGTYFIAMERESSNVFFWEDDKELPVKITSVRGKVIDYEISEGKIYLIGVLGLSGTELYVQELSNPKSLTRISEENVRLEEEYLYAPVSYLPYVNANGIKLQGWYLKPVDFEEGKKYPTILFIHGGPQVAYGEVFNLDMQLMAANGYGVIYCNPTGSEGRGGDFGDIRMKYGTIDYEDLVGFTKYAADNLSWIDRERLGITGGSYGGIMTNWIIGHTDLFKAAVSDRSSVNNLSDFGLSDIGVSFALDTYETTPWENFEFLWDSSPLKYACNIKTPTLWIHGMEDYRCTFDGALQMHTALTYFGVPSKVVGFKGEHHGMSRTGKPKHRIRRMEEMVSWFDKYLK